MPVERDIEKWRALFWLEYRSKPGETCTLRPKGNGSVLGVTGNEYFIREGWQGSHLRRASWWELTPTLPDCL